MTKPATPPTHQPDREADRPGAVRSRTRVASDGARWNELITQVLREAAEVRDGLQQARSAEDARLTRMESEACLALIGTRRSPASGPAASPERPRSRGTSTGKERR